MKLLNVIIFGLVMLTIRNGAAVDVNIANLGIVRGISRNIDGKTIDIFQGIPYAQPPVGNLRLKPPVNVFSWSGVRNATNPNIFCPQRHMVTRTIVGNEDCLYLNIYRPAGISSGFPVMVWIHGGGFTLGSGSEYNGEMLAAKHHVLVVTINYRLGVLGFFNVPGTTTKGNFGLQDQIMALQWIKSHVTSFGGDKDIVTIFGESAGAASVTLLMLSPLTKGLFSRAIAQSGSPTCPWAIQNENNEKFSKDYASKLGCKGDSTTLTACLRGKTWREIMQQQILLEESHPVATPCVDGDVIKAFPRDQLEAGTLPISSVELLSGFNKDEGTMFVPVLSAWNQTIFDNGLKNVLKWQFKDNADKVLRAVSYNYAHYNQKSEYLKYALGMNDFIADYQFIKCGIDFAAAWTKANSYLYEFTYLPPHRRLPHWLVSHGLEIDFVFGKPFYDKNHPGGKAILLTNFTQGDRNVSADMMSMWVNFARLGNPGNSWPKYDTQTKQYLKIDLNPVVQSNARPKAMEFWGKFIPELVKMTSKRPMPCVNMTSMPCVNMTCPAPKIPGKATNTQLSIALIGLTFGVILMFY